MTPNLSFDEVLTTTKSVRKRLDLTRHVEREVLTECFGLAGAAPSAQNGQPYRWLTIDDEEIRSRVADLWREARMAYRLSATKEQQAAYESESGKRMAESANYLEEHLHEVPVLVIPVVRGVVEGSNIFQQSALWGSILPAMWSFMLALRSRGLGSAWTAVHLNRHAEMAALLNIPNGFTQAGLLPVAYTIGEAFRPAVRRNPTELISWNHWPDPEDK